MEQYIFTSGAKTTYYMVFFDDWLMDCACICADHEYNKWRAHECPCNENSTKPQLGLNVCANSRLKFKFVERENLVQLIRYFHDQYTSVDELSIMTVIVPENTNILKLGYSDVEGILEAACVYALSIEPIKESFVWTDDAIMSELAERKLIKPSIEPELCTTREMCMKLIDQNPEDFEKLPKHLIDKDLCMYAVRRSIWYVTVIPAHLITVEMLIMAARLGASGEWEHVEFFKDRVGMFDTPALRLELVKKCGILLQIFPPELITFEMCRAAVESYGQALSYIPAGFLNIELCHAAVKNDPGALSTVPGAFINHEMCLEAVSKNISLFDKIPACLINRKICMEAVSQKGDLLGKIPANLIDKEICMAAVSNFSCAIQYVPTELISREIFDRAFHNWCSTTNVRLYKYLPKIYQHNEMVVRVVQKDLRSLSIVDEKFMNLKLCELAIEKDSDAIEFVPAKILTAEMCKNAVELGCSITKVPQKFVTSELCSIYIENSTDAENVGLLPEHMMSEGLLTRAVKKDGHALWFIPDKFVTVELCRIAAKQNKNVLRYVPVSFLDKLKGSGKK